MAGVSTSVADPALNDLWTIPGEEDLLEEFQAEDRRLAQTQDVMKHYHALQIDDFLLSIREGRDPAVTGADGRAVVEMTDAIYRSQREGRSIRIPDQAGG